MSSSKTRSNVAPSMDRRSFLRMGSAASAMFVAPDLLHHDPYALFRALDRGRPVRVRGTVRSGGRGLPRVGVTDGLQVVETNRDGSYELITAGDREFVSLSVPSGYQLPRNELGIVTGFERVQANRGGDARADFTLDRLHTDESEHTMLLLADVQTQDSQEMAWFHEQSVPDVMSTVQTLGYREVFGVACGDIMYDDLSLYSEYERGVQRMGVPFLQVVGNHDLDLDERTDEASTTTFTRHFGPRYRSFDRGAVHYVILDDVFWHGAGYLGYLAVDQLTWLENDLRRVEPGRPVIVALHIPVLGSRHVRRGERSPGVSISVTNRELLYRLLEPYQAHVVCGHTHESEHNTSHGVHEHVSGTVCGAWWSGPICADGTPNGYAVYDVDGESISWRYKSTGFDDVHQMRVYPHGADPRAPDEIVANVWDWDDGWHVVWYEDGMRRGQMSRRMGFDPLSVELHTGDDLPPRRTWVEPYPTNHMFYAPASRLAREIRVEVTDRFGRVYSARVGSGP